MKYYDKNRNTHSSIFGMVISDILTTIFGSNKQEEEIDDYEDLDDFIDDEIDQEEITPGFEIDDGGYQPVSITDNGDGTCTATVKHV